MTPREKSDMKYIIAMALIAVLIGLMYVVVSAVW
jgi:hypothetical protein